MPCQSRVQQERTPVDHDASRPCRDAEPRSRPGELQRELPVENDHGADVLQRRSEAQLADELRSAFRGLDRHAPDAHEPDDRERERERRTDHCRRDGNGARRDREQRQAREQRAGCRLRTLGEVGDGPRDEREPDHGRPPVAHPGSGRHERGAPRREHGERTERDARRNPRGAVARKAERRQVPGDRAEQGAGGHDAAQLTPCRVAEHGPARHRGEQDVRHVRCLERERPASGARTQTGGDRERDDQAEGRGPVAEDVREVGRAHRVGAEEP